MLVTWDPEDGSDKQTWQFDPDEVLRKDATQIERHFGGSWDQWLAALQIGKIDARAVLLWYMLKLVHPKTRFDDVPDFRVRQLRVDQGVTELKRLYDRVKKMRLDPDVREAFESQFEADMREAMEREGFEGSFEVVDGVLSIEAADGVVYGEALPKAL